MTSTNTEWPAPASCGHLPNADGECGCSSWPERAPYIESAEGTDLYGTRAISRNGQPVHDTCRQPLRWSTAYDEPHWVHTSILDVLSCPPSSLR